MDSFRQNAKLWIETDFDVVQIHIRLQEQSTGFLVQEILRDSLEYSQGKPISRNVSSREKGEKENKNDHETGTHGYFFGSSWPRIPSRFLCFLISLSAVIGPMPRMLGM